LRGDDGRVEVVTRVWSKTQNCIADAPNWLKPKKCTQGERSGPGGRGHSYQV
jgi:hypothetical protein